jgi:putative tryptophan/tyrosine transport system substrate-binding protein
MRRRLFLLAAGMVLAPLTARAQQPARIARVGFLAMGNRDDWRLKTFTEAMRKLGYVEGKSFVIEARFAELGRYEQFDPLAAELVVTKPDIIVAPLNPEISALRRATSVIPVVMVISGEPEKQGFVRSLARPGGNVTGLAWAMSEEIEEKSVEILAESVPGLSRVAGLLDAGYEITDIYWDMAERAARSRKLDFRRYKVRSHAELERAFADMKRDRVGAVLVGGGRLFNENAAPLAALGLRHRIPLHFKTPFGAEAGGLVAYGPDIYEFYRRAADYVHRILRGARPADLPVEHPAKYQLTLNLKTARTLGITFPQAVLVRADRVIQ